jgi:ferredoxin
MPKVVFVNEHRVAQAAAGTKLKALAVELGVNLHRESFRGLNCGYLGLCGACQVWVRAANPEAAETATSRRNLREKWAGTRGERRLACQVRILGDIEVTTMAGVGDRTRTSRPIAPPPQPTVDPTARRKPPDAAPTAEFVYGHPSAVGSGTRVPAERQTSDDEKAGDS